MSGPEHYKESERLLRLSDEIPTDFTEGALAIVAQAQVHATLALAAATVDAVPDPDQMGNRDAWIEVVK